MEAQDFIMSANTSSRELQWTPELVARFWDNWANSRKLHDQFFTFRLGEAITNFLSSVTDIRDRRLLDYGCGPGFLEEHLLRRGARVTGADYSPETVRSVNERFANRGGWEEASLITDGTIAASDSSFDIVTCIETIEHMFEPARLKMLTEFRRILKPGGRLMITTPNEEDLQRNRILCPHCGHTFHMWQHLCSWSKENLTGILHDTAFSVDFCAGIDLTRWMRRGQKKAIDYSIRDLKGVFFDAYRGAADRMFPKPFPHGRVFRHLSRVSNPVHLVAIATK